MAKIRSTTKQVAGFAMAQYVIFNNAIASINLSENKDYLQQEADYWMKQYLKLTSKQKSLFKELGF